MNHKLKSRLQEEVSIASDMQMSKWQMLSNGRKQRRTKETLDEGEREEGKSLLKSQHSKN